MDTKQSKEMEVWLYDLHRGPNSLKYGPFEAAKDVILGAATNLEHKHPQTWSPLAVEKLRWAASYLDTLQDGWDAQRNICQNNDRVLMEMFSDRENPERRRAAQLVMYAQEAAWEAQDEAGGAGDLRDELGELVLDEDLTDEKLRAASENLLPRLYDRMGRTGVSGYVSAPSADAAPAPTEVGACEVATKLVEAAEVLRQCALIEPRTGTARIGKMDWVEFDRVHAEAVRELYRLRHQRRGNDEG